MTDVIVAQLQIRDGAIDRPFTKDDISTGSVLGGRFSVRAAVDLSGHRILTPNGLGQAFYAQPSVGLHGPFWLSTAAAVQDALVPVVAYGEVEESSWDWTPNTSLYLAADGTIIPTAPVTGLLVEFAVSLTATSIFVNPKPPISLS